ncbi:MAG: ABC transporter permease [Planctomycetaceae bacterium]
MIPLKYNVRNLRVRWVNTLLTVLGTGLVVWSSCAVFSMVEGLRHSLTISGDPLDLIVLRKGSSAETTGGFDATKADDLATLGGLARDEQGRPLAAPELLNIPMAERIDGSWTNIIVRGVVPVSRALRPHFRIVQGRDLEPGRGECIVSRSLARRFKGAAIGGILKVGEKESYRVVGLFTAGGSAAESEAWADIKDVARHMGREGTVSVVQLRAASESDLERIKAAIDDETRFRLAAMRETEFFAQQTQSSLFLKGVGTVIAVLLTFGAMFAAANTMYAAVAARTREIGTLRALGFSRLDILLSFLGESVLLCTLGGLLGLVATIPLGALTFGTSNFNTFAEMTVRFRFGPLVMAVALAMTLAMGVFGGLFPALRAVRLDVIRALREL